MFQEKNYKMALRAALLVPFFLVGLPSAHAALPAAPYMTEFFVNKAGVLGMAWAPTAGATSMRLQVSNLSANGCQLNTATSSTCFVNKAVSLNGPLNPAANTGVSVAAFNGGNIYARLVAVDSTGKQMRPGAWMKVPHYLGLTSGGKSWPLPSVAPGVPVTVSASVSNSTLMTEFWVFDIQGNSPNKTRSGLNFTVTPMTVGPQQTWVLKSKTNTGLVVDQGTVQVKPLICGGSMYMDLPYVGTFAVSQGNNGATSHHQYPLFDNTYAVDIAVPKNTPVRSPVDGVIIAAYGVDNKNCVGGGRAVAIQDNISGKKITLMHFSSIAKSSGAVKKGDVVGYAGGSSGVGGVCKDGTWGNHIHFHLWTGVDKIDSHTQPFTQDFKLRTKNPSGQEVCLYGNQLNDNKIVNQKWTSYLN